VSAALKKVDKPPLLRFALALFKPFGASYVEEGYAQVITRFGHFHALKGPGLIWRFPLFDSLGSLAYVGGDMVDRTFHRVLSRDLVPVNIRLTCLVMYDPRAAIAASAGRPNLPALAGVPRESLKEIAIGWFEWGLGSLANRYYATELPQAEVRADLEKQLFDLATREMAVLSLKPVGRVRLMQVELPASLTERQQTIAQRRASIEAGAEYDPEVVRRSLVTEIMEKIARGNAEMPLMNLNELVNAYLGDTVFPPSAPPAESAVPPDPHKPVEPTPPPVDTPPAESKSTGDKPKPRPASRF
jgi:hypothetical protein